MATAELDSEEEDDDYVPDQDPLEIAERNRIAAEEAAAARAAAPFDPNAPVIEFGGRAGAAVRDSGALARKKRAAAAAAAAAAASASAAGGSGGDGADTGSMEQALVGPVTIGQEKSCGG